MRWHKPVAYIFLFLSIVNFTFADLAQTPKMLHEIRVDSVTGADEASEGGHTHSGELPEWLRRPLTAGNSHSRFDIPGVHSFNSRDDPVSVKFFNEKMNKKYKKYLLLGVIDGVLTGISNGMIDEIFGTVSPNAESVGRSVELLNDEHPQDQEDLVSRSLSNMGDDDIKMLSIISRRMLNLIRRAASERDADRR